MITQGDRKVEILKDGWTVVTADGKLAAHFEHTIAVTDDGPRILTLRDYGEHPDVAKYVPVPSGCRPTNGSSSRRSPDSGQKKRGGQGG